MGVVRGLSSITGHLDAVEAKFSGNDSVKATWFKINDKQNVRVLFLQELDEDAENYSAKNDLGILAVEHVHPDNFMIKALCSADDETGTDCYGCEQYADFSDEKNKKWRPKNRLYINVLVDDGNKEPYVAILSQGNGPKSITPNLIEEATENGSISDHWFKIKRLGAKLDDTAYTLTALRDAGPNVEDYELFDLNSVVKNIPYHEQEAFYNRGSNGSSAKEPAFDVVKPAVDTDADLW